jgi:ABC-type uncharacterized transport system auxiliary subunit
MHQRVRLALAVLAVAAFCSCLGGRAVKYFTVTIPAASQPTAHAFPVALVVGHISAPEILQDQPIVYRSGRNEIGAYEYHLWAEPPAQMIKIALIRRLRASGQYQSVTRLGGSTHGDYVLRGRLYDFEEVDNGGTITAEVSMDFELIDRATYKPVWNHFYSRTMPVQGKVISAVVAALDNNLQQGLAEVESGLNTYFASHGSGRP